MPTMLLLRVALRQEKAIIVDLSIARRLARERK